MSIKLRIAQQPDIEVLVDLVRQYHQFEGIESDANTIAAALTPLLQESDDGRVWLIHKEDAVIGYIALCFGYSIEFRGRDAFVDEIFIVREHRGTGAGTTALAEVRDAARRLGIKALHLEVARDNERAQRLYRAAGFESRKKYFLMSRAL